MVEEGSPASSSLGAGAADARGLERRSFLWFQAVMWALLCTTALVPGLGFARVPPGALLLWTAGWTGCGLLASTVIALGLARLPDRTLRGPRGIFIVLPAAIVGSVSWTAMIWGLEPLIGREPMLPHDISGLRLQVLNTVRGTLLLWLWAALFLVNLLSERMQRTREHSVRALAAADRAQLQLLRSQVNPHFLFNALNSVVALIGENPRGAQGMVRDVAALLRQALDVDGSRDVTLQHELDFVRLYLKCEQVRFEERLVVEFDVEPGVEGLWVPPMLLHPLAENAIKHGMQGLATGPLRVHISARRDGGRLALGVTNNGTLRPPRVALVPPGAGIGLRNLRERLAQLFPGQHCFELAERDGRVIASLELPAREIL